MSPSSNTIKISPAIECQQLQYAHGGFRLKNIELSVPYGQLTAIVGPNGSGKSTLLRILAGLTTPESEGVRILGEELRKFPRRKLARTLAMLPQSKHVPENLTVRELVAYGRSPYQSPWNYSASAEDNQWINHALKLTGTSSYADRMFHTLSGGEQQRARIAMTLAQNTDIMLLDEPTTFLDITHQFDVMNMLASINRETGITIVMVLHDLPQAVAFSHHMIALRGGVVVTEGSPRVLLDANFLKNVYDLEASVTYVENYPVIIPKPYYKLEE
ncbi:ABC transporter ATP-binding protein [Paenibacillus sp. VTT E-133280]|uniref:ABC transporter ATP-binding protein n=1 Tax=Paenibacillus sp. VTT E-133280 TaxID=1986222 RepID=UPI00211AAF2D|nr:ABC transporter ATP-binding protein [Paenibacillus sp. VTT E-133280]